jgi:hypothetical protein
VSGRRRLTLLILLSLAAIAAGSAQALTVKSYSTYLGEVRTALGQWEGAIESWRGSNFLITPDGTNTGSASQLQALLGQWEAAIENQRGQNFLASPTADATDSVFDLHSLLNQWQNAIEAWRGSHFIVEPPGPYSFGTPTKTGSFSLKPKTPTVEVGERADYEIGWKVPKPNNWHDLKTIDFRVCDGKSLLRVRWNELENTLWMRDARTVAAGEVGEDKTLQVPTAELQLGSSSVTGNGETGRRVTIVLDLAFKRRAAGVECDLMLAAADDLGNRDPSKRAGRIRVN